MKVIGLLNKIANGEDLLEKIRYDEKIWKLDPLNDNYDNGECCLFEDYIDEKYVITDVLNDEIEIIEEDKKIEHLDIYNCFKVMGIDKTGRLDENFTDISNKINEIIDKLNKEE